MAISDVTMDALVSMTGEVADIFSDDDVLNKSTVYIGSFFDLLYQLAEFSVPFAFPPTISDDIKEQAVDRMVIANVLSHANSQNEDLICLMMAKTSLNCAKLSTSIERIHAHFGSENSLFNMMKEPDFARQSEKMFKAKLGITGGQA